MSCNHSSFDFFTFFILLLLLSSFCVSGFLFYKNQELTRDVQTLQKYYEDELFKAVNYLNQLKTSKEKVFELANEIRMLEYKLIVQQSSENNTPQLQRFSSDYQKVKNELGLCTGELQRSTSYIERLRDEMGKVKDELHQCKYGSKRNY